MGCRLRRCASRKINLSVAYKTGKHRCSPALKAEQYLLENETTKNYLGIDGIPGFARFALRNCCSAGSALINDSAHARRKRAVPARYALPPTFGKKYSGKRVWVSN
ncbi:hypothetical protein KCP75_04165 [Salmonella enterica subsp. enterica]|nr:hypothetical protein KCP75_04165 [Salmonella enterica subsp. enterica]